MNVGFLTRNLFGVGVGQPKSGDTTVTDQVSNSSFTHSFHLLCHGWFSLSLCKYVAHSRLVPTLFVVSLFFSFLKLFVTLLGDGAHVVHLVFSSKLLIETSRN